MANRNINNSGKYLTCLDKASQLRIIVLGYFVRRPMGEMVWSNLVNIFVTVLIIKW